MAFRYPGRGRQLFLSTDLTDATIPDTAYSEPEPVNDARSIALSVVFASAPGAIASVSVELATEPGMGDAHVIQTLTPGASDTATQWADRETPLNGFIRIQNTSGVNITEAVIQKEVASWG